MNKNRNVLEEFLKNLSSEIISGNKELFYIISLTNLNTLSNNDDIAIIRDGITNLGFNTNLQKTEYTNWIGVLYNGGDIIFETGECDEESSFSYFSDLGIIEIYNKLTERCEVCSIMINEKEYTAKANILNIVITDGKNVIDSVGFELKEDTRLHMIRKRFDVALLGCWWGANYGSVLNGYAIYKILKKLNKKVLMVHKHDAGSKDWEVTDSHNVHFIHKFYEEADVSPNYSFYELDSLNDYCDVFISGSDQIWNYGINRLFKYAFMLNFVDSSKKKISFGTSFGHSSDNTPEDKFHFIKALLNDFNAISVREHFSQDILKNNYGIKAKYIIEPVFCIEKNEYDFLAEQSEIKTPETYILAYILDPTEEKKKAIDFYTRTSGKKALIVLDGDPRVFNTNRKKIDNEGVLENVCAHDLLKLYKNADFIITDSFHGTAFSIIYNKPFLAINNKRRGEARFIELLKMFNLFDRFSDNPNNINMNASFLEQPDYDRINMMIKKSATEAVEWLKYAIETPADALPEITLTETSADNYTRPKHGAHRLIYKSSKELLQYDSTVMKFRFDHSVWEQHRINNVETLFTKPLNPPIGKFACLKLFNGLIPGKQYKFSIKFKIRTLHERMNFHIKDSDSSKYQVIKSCNIRGINSGNEWIETEQIFIPDSADYNEFMIGAAQLSGEDSYISLAYINIMEL